MVTAVRMDQLAVRVEAAACRTQAAEKVEEVVAAFLETVQVAHLELAPEAGWTAQEMLEASAVVQMVAQEGTRDPGLAPPVRSRSCGRFGTAWKIDPQQTS